MGLNPITSNPDLQALDTYIADKKRYMLVLRKKKDGSSYLEAVEKGLFKNFKDTLLFKLKWLLPSRLISSYQDSTIRTYLLNKVKSDRSLSKDQQELMERIKTVFGQVETKNLSLSSSKAVSTSHITIQEENALQLNDPASSQHKTKAPRSSKTAQTREILRFSHSQPKQNVRGLGIDNGGNRCYFNATIKALRACPSFRKRINDYEKRYGAKLLEDIELASWLRELYWLIDAGSSQERNNYHNSIGQRSNEGLTAVDQFAIYFGQREEELAFLEERQSFPIHEYQQQDAYEFCSILFQHLFTDTEDESFTIIEETKSHPLQGLGTTLPLLDSSQPEQHQFLMMTIPDIGESSLQDIFKGTSQVREVLINPEDRNLTKEFLLKVKKLYKNHNGTFPVQVKSATKIVGKAPDLLPIQIKRYTNTWKNGRVELNKNSRAVEAPFMLQVPVEGRNKKTTIETYILRSVVLHSGSSIRSGHYYSYVPDPTSVRLDKRTQQLICDRWYDHNDSEVYPVKLKRYTREEPQYTVQENIRRNGYLFFYERVP